MDSGLTLRNWNTILAVIQEKAAEEKAMKGSIARKIKELSERQREMECDGMDYQDIENEILDLRLCMTDHGERAAELSELVTKIGNRIC